MDEEIDKFKNLKELRLNNVVREFKAKLVDSLNELPENDDADIDLLLNSIDKKANTKRRTRIESVKQYNVTKNKKSVQDDAKKATLVKLNGTVTNKIRNVEENAVQGAFKEQNVLNTLHEELDENQPVVRRTRNSLKLDVNVQQTFSPLNNYNQSQTVTRSNRGKGRERGQVKGARRNATRYNSEALNLIHAVGANDCEDMSTNVSSSIDMTQNNRRQTRSSRLRVVQACRSYFNEKAARATQIDYIDLISSPMPRVEGFINLDSDEDVESESKNDNSNCPATTSITSSQSILIDEDNPEVLIKIKWSTYLETWKVRKYEKFHDMFQKIAQREKTDIKNILLSIENRIIGPGDTPDSIDYKIYQFLIGRILEKALNSPITNAGQLKQRSKNCIVLKIQSDKWKRPLEVDLLKTDKFRILYIKCSEELSVPIEKLKLSFDGEVLNHDDTPVDVELEGNEIIDLTIKK